MKYSLNLLVQELKMKLWQKIVLDVVLTVHLFFSIVVLLVLVVSFDAAIQEIPWIYTGIGTIFLLLIMGGIYGIGGLFSWRWKVQINLD